MSKKIIKVTDDIFDNAPAMRAYIMRRLWYAYYREIRIANREQFERLIRGDGHNKPGLTGILNGSK